MTQLWMPRGGFPWSQTMPLADRNPAAARGSDQRATDMGRRCRGCPAVPVCWSRINIPDLSLANLCTSWTSCFPTMPPSLSTKFLKLLNQYDLLLFPTPARPVPPPCACKWVSCSLSYLLDASSLEVKERKAHVCIGPLGQLSSQQKTEPLLSLLA